MRVRRLIFGALVTALAAQAVGCIVTQVKVEPVERPAASTPGAASAPARTAIAFPVRAHLSDGSTVLFRSGVIVTRDSISGLGYRYGLTLRDSAAVSALPLDSVVGMEAYAERPRKAEATLLTTGVVVVAAVGTAALLKAIFGSCPTFYTDSAGTYTLEAEGFSYSVAPLFEARDVDRLAGGADSAGALEVEVRNEALETHYLNHLAALEVRHGRDERVVPDQQGRPLALSDFRPAPRATDRAGRDVRAELADPDAVPFASAPSVVERAAAPASARADLVDHVELVVAPPAAGWGGRDSVAVEIRARNSLLTTVLFYDVLLGARGARAVTWLSDDLGRIGHAVEFGRWYAERMGLRVAAWDGDAYREVGRLRDSGPIAWHDAAVVVAAPRAAHDSLRLRLSFAPDEWRIDRVRVASGVRRPAPRALPLARAVGADGAGDSRAARALAAADDGYLETTPGQRFTARFEAGPIAADSARTFFLVSQGYYTEWVRGSWMRDAADAGDAPLVPGDDLLREALRRWRASGDSLEQRFYSTRIPVR